MNCIIIEDEPLAQDILELYICKTPKLNLVAQYDNALSFIRNFNQLSDINLIFLDIQMPEINGFELLRMMKSLPEVIVTTAYNDYALEAFNLNVIDYLTKPIAYDRFLQAIQKTKSFSLLGNSIEEVIKPLSFFAKSDKKLVNVFFNDIIYIESCRNYIAVNLDNNKKILIHTSLQNFIENNLISSEIVQVHRSFLIHIQKIKEIQGNEIILNNNYSIPIGNLYKERFFEMLNILK